jgi:hypothetical protein
MIISKGFALDERSQIAALYWKAFGAKLGRVMAPEGKALAFVERVLDPTHSICARDADWALRGVAGFKTMDGALVGGTFRDLSQTYGIWGAVWRAGLLQLLERDTENAPHAGQSSGGGGGLLRTPCRQRLRRSRGNPPAAFPHNFGRCARRPLLTKSRAQECLIPTDREIGGGLQSLGLWSPPILE